MIYEKTILIQKDPQNGTITSNYRPITCQLMMWKILTAPIREEVYDLLICRGLFPVEETGCYTETGELLYIDTHKESNTRKNVAMTLFDNKRLWNSPAKLDSRLSENIQDIRQSHKIHPRSLEKQVSCIGRRKNNCRSKNPEWYFQGRYAFAITICNNNNATRLNT